MGVFQRALPGCPLRSEQGGQVRQERGARIFRAVGEEGQPPAEDRYGRVDRVRPVGRLEPGGAAQKAEVVTRGPVRDEDLRGVGVPAPLLALAGGGKHLSGGLPGRDVVQHDPGQAVQEAQPELAVTGLRHN